MFSACKNIDKKWPHTTGIVPIFTTQTTLSQFRKYVRLDFFFKWRISIPPICYLLNTVFLNKFFAGRFQCTSVHLFINMLLMQTYSQFLIFHLYFTHIAAFPCINSVETRCWLPNWLLFDQVIASGALFGIKGTVWLMLVWTFLFGLSCVAKLEKSQR